MFINANGFEIDLKARETYLEADTVFNPRDTRKLLTDLAVFMGEAREALEKDHYDGLAAEAREYEQAFREAYRSLEAQPWE